MRKLGTVIVVLAGLVAGCAAPPPQRPSAPAYPPGFPLAIYEAASQRGDPVYVVDDTEGQSLVVRVYRDGTLAKLAHDHVVSTASVRGYALIPVELARARIDLFVPVDEFRVDMPSVVRDAGMQVELTDAQIAGTRNNMETYVLESSRFPFVVVDAHCAPVRDCSELDARITLHGVSRAVRIPVAVRRESGRLVVEGKFPVNQSDFGITPFSAVGGAIRVADHVDVEFRLVLRPPLMAF